MHSDALLQNLEIIKKIHTIQLDLQEFKGEFIQSSDMNQPDKDNKCVFLTIHDVLCNHTSIKAK